MVLFSERYGYKSVRDSLQFECMDDELRTALWNFLCKFPIKSTGLSGTSLIGPTINNYPHHVKKFYIDLWGNFWKRPLDEFNNVLHSPNPYDELRQFFFTCEWYEVYDFLEFFAKKFPLEDSESFNKSANHVLESENSAYRFINSEITPISSEAEIETVEEAIINSPDPVQIHLNEALKLLSNKQSPNLRNSIKESISAVESICNMINGDKSTSLGQALNKMERNNIIQLHGALRRSFSSLYGYANDANGIRHALLEEPNLELEDAKFMLVSCSAFINYLLTKADKSNIKLNKKSDETLEKIFHLLKQTLDDNNIDYSKIIEDFGQVEAAEKREKGYEFTFNEHLKALIYSMLSNRRKWADIVDKLPLIEAIFFNFDPDKLEKCDTEALIDKIREIKCGNMSIYKQIDALPHNIRQLKKIEKEFGSLDTFVIHKSLEEIVKLLSDGKSEYKIKQMGDALALEYLKSVGIRGMKPDVHILRICGPERLDIITAKDTQTQLEEFKNFAESVNVSETYLDNLIWIFGAKGYGEICTANPKCDKCELTNYCNYKN